MGYFTEINTLLRLPKDFDTSRLALSKSFTIVKEKERVFPLHIAVLLIDEDWNFYGYVVVHESVLKDKTTTLRFEVLSLFSPKEQKLYKDKFLQAAKITGEI